jgi:DNA adenine methylase
MPNHIHYVEPYAGSLAVLLERDPNRNWLGDGGSSSTDGCSEVVNDLNGALTNFWRVLRDPTMFAEFERTIQAMPCSQVEFDAAGIAAPVGESPVATAVWFFVRCRQSRSGCFKDFTTIAKTRTRRGMNELPSAWWNAIEGLPAVHARLKRVVILNEDALVVIRKQDTPNTLFYLDPPYLHETRTSTGQYANEMSDQQHSELLGVLVGIKGKFQLSGYRSELYDSVAADNGWRRVDFDAPNNAAGGEKKRRMTECLWMNYP